MLFGGLILEISRNFQKFRFAQLIPTKRHFENDEAETVEPFAPRDFFEGNQVMPAIASVVGAINRLQPPIEGQHP